MAKSTTTNPTSSLKTKGQTPPASSLFALSSPLKNPARTQPEPTKPRFEPSAPKPAHRPFSHTALDTHPSPDITSRLTLVHTRYWLPPLLFLSVLFAAPKSAKDGVYSKAQATRGKAVYEEECAKCHGMNLAGGDGSPDLVGTDFIDRWKTRSVGDLYTFIKKTMPTDDPGHLANRQYTDLVTYILSANEFPAGPADLDATGPAINEISLDTSK